MKMNYKLLIKVLTVAIPTYTIAFITESMVYTIPMLAITTVIATNLFTDEQNNLIRLEELEEDNLE